MATVAEDDAVRVNRLQLGPFGTNAYVVTCLQTQHSAVIDAPDDAGAIIDGLKGSTPQHILLTHNHIDHIGALDRLRTELKVPLAAHNADAGILTSPPEIWLSDGDVVRLGDLELKVLHTPGHTPGSVCFQVGRYLVSGDTIFPGGPGRTNSPTDFTRIVRSIREKIFALPDDTQIYPGHGEPTVLLKEKHEFSVFVSRPHDPELCGDVLWLSA